MNRERDVWSQRLAAVAWPAIAAVNSVIWSKVALAAIAGRRERRRPVTSPSTPALHHVQLAIPPNREDEARLFYGELLGLPEVAKPANLAARGGCWFAAGDRQIHLGVEQDFRPARKAHPAFQVARIE